MVEWNPPRAIEIDKKLPDNFRHLLREYRIATRETDLMLPIQVDWWLPCGWADVGPSPPEAVVREIRDETGLE
jgi:ADP-ribose pyrophosphatase YjhB (NUDIX family)